MQEILNEKFSKLQEEADKVTEALQKALDQKAQLENTIEGYKAHLLRIEGAGIILRELQEDEVKRTEAEKVEKPKKEA